MNLGNCILGFLLLLCVGHSYGEELVAEFPLVKMKSDTIAMIVRKDIEPALIDYYYDKPKILMASGNKSTIRFEDMSDHPRIAEEYLNDVIGYIIVGQFYVLIDKSLSRSVKAICQQKKSFDMIKVFKLNVPGMVTIVMSDPWQWAYKIENGKIIPDSRNPYAY